MVKECKIILNNSAVTVVKFGDVEVQFPHIDTEFDTVKVSFENGKYEVVKDDKKEARKPKKQKENTDEKEIIAQI